MIISIANMDLLEETVDKELKESDIYECPISKEHMNDVKEYFEDNRPDLKVYRKSSYDIIGLTKQYKLVFQKSGGI